jgi:glycosyltransferase involved in cell wall biosynthesis
MKLPGLGSLKFHLTRRLGLRPRFDYGVVSTDPLVLVSHYDPVIWDILESLRGLELHCFVFCYWSLEVPDQQEIALRLARWMRRHSHHRIEHLAASESELAVLSRLGVPGFVCNQNGFVDESVFRVLPDTPKIHRAVYDARLTPFKRHELAARIEDLALITYEIPLNRDPDYNRRTRELLARATWLNGPFSAHPGSLTPEQIAGHLNQARVGLILSELEGANFASIQYLLCGLPVVTTPNRGGRDVFFDPDHVIHAEPTPEAVAAAVDELIARDIPPALIRERTLAKVAAQRDVFKNRLRELCAPAAPPPWRDYFRNKLMSRHSPLELRLLRLKARLAPRRASRTT